MLEKKSLVKIGIFSVIVLVFCAGIYALKNGRISILRSPFAQSNTLAPPAMLLEKDDVYDVILETSQGAISIRLLNTVPSVAGNNFVYLVLNNVYDNTPFHRIVEGSYIQGGNPDNNGSGDAGYTLQAQPFTGAYLRGMVAMYSDAGGNIGSQFFITLSDTDIAEKHAVFGEVTEGMDIVDAIANTPLEENRSGERSKPVLESKILTARVYKNGEAFPAGSL